MHIAHNNTEVTLERIKINKYGLVQRGFDIGRVQSCVLRLLKYWPPTPLSTRRVCPLPATGGGGIHSPGGEGGGGSIFWKTLGIWLASYSNNLSTVWCIGSLIKNITEKFDLIKSKSAGKFVEKVSWITLKVSKCEIFNRLDFHDFYTTKPFGLMTLGLKYKLVGGATVGITLWCICSVRYNDFNNLVMQTLWWLPNKILRHNHFFEPFLAHLQSKFTKSAKNSKK